jgi:hypothetical protein
VDNLIVTGIANGTFFSSKKEGSTDTWLNLENTTLGKKSQTQRDTVHIKCPEWTNTQRQGWGVGRGLGVRAV